MSIPGDGTSSNPYKPTTWEELLSVATTQGVFIELPEGGGTFDMNIYYPDGIPDTINLKGSINGNGWKIKNAFWDGTGPAFSCSSNRTDTLSNLDFENFYIRNQPSSSSSDINYLLGIGYDNNNKLMDNCRFSGRIEGPRTISSPNWSCLLYGGTYTTEVWRCSFNLDIYGHSVISASNNWVTEFNECNFKIIHHDEVEMQNAFNNCYITGDVYDLGTITSSGLITSTSIFDLNIRHTLRNVGGTGNTNIVNTSKYSGTIPAGFTGLTTSDLKNAQTIASTGFPIQV